MACTPEISGTKRTSVYRGLHADVIVYIFAHLHKALLTEIKMLDMS